MPVLRRIIRHRTHTAEITEVPGGINVSMKCPHGNQYTQTSSTGMYCDKADCRCKSDGGKIAQDLQNLIDQFIPR